MDLVIQRLGIWSIPDYARQAVKADSAAVKLSDPLLPSRVQAAAGAALKGAICAVNRARLALPEGVEMVRNRVALHAPVHAGVKMSA